MRALAMVVLFLLAACGPKPSAPPAAPTPPPPAANGLIGDFRKPIDAKGTEPFWNVAIRGRTLTLTRPEGLALTAVAPGAVVSPTQASWTGKTPEGAELKITLYASPCSDGMSDHAYPYAAEVAVAGEGPLSGCADLTATLAARPKP